MFFQNLILEVVRLEKSFKPLNQFNAFFKLAHERTLCGVDQLVGLHIQNFFNKSHWAETIQVADAELLECINWYDKTGSPTSIDTIRTAKARLKKKGFIDFAPGKGNRPTEYRLIRLYPTDTPADTPTNTPADTGVVSYTRVRAQDVKDLKTDDDDGRVREGDVAQATKPQVSNTSALPLKSPIAETDANAIQDEWEKAFGYELRGDRAITLEQYAAKDYARTQAAMAKTARKLPLADPFAYFQKVYDECTPQQTRVSASPPSPPKKQDDSAAEERRKLFGWE